MSLNGQTFEKKQRPIPPQGPQAAICYSIVDCGTHNVSFQGQPAKQTPLVHFSWEFPNLPFAVFKEGEQPKPLAVFQEYTVALGDRSKLQKMLTSWRGVTPQDLSKELPVFIGQPCMINVEYKHDKQKPEIIYANVGANGIGIMRLPAGMQVGKLTNPTMFFNLDNYSHEQYLKLPTFLQKKIASSLEWSGIVAKYGQPPVQQQNNAQNQGFNQQPNNQFQQQGFQQNTGFQQPVNNQVFNHGQNQFNQQPAQNQGVQFGGETINTNPFQDPPF